jgi:hypothetical protein
LLHGWMMSQGLIQKSVKNCPHNHNHDDDKNQPNTEINELGLLPPLDGGNDRRAAMPTRPRMIADFSMTFVTWDEGHNYSMNHLPSF